MFCIKCGVKLPDDANFCLKCGQPQAGNKSPSSSFNEYEETCTVEHERVGHAYYLRARCIGRPGVTYQRFPKKLPTAGFLEGYDLKGYNSGSKRDFDQYRAVQDEFINLLTSQGWVFESRLENGDVTLKRRLG
jgi:hypothetical protein